MRTDDFDGPKSQDRNDNRPEVRAMDHDGDDGFNEFDAPPPASGNSLGDIWRNNPIVKIGVLVVGVIIVIIGLAMFGGESREDKIKSDAGRPVQNHEAPGGETPESYRTAVEEENQRRLNQALQTGQSAIPIPTATPDSTSLQPTNEEPPVNIDDPLQNWRSAQQDTSPAPTLEPTSPQVMPEKQQQQGPMGPDPAAVDAMAQAMGQQMKSILDKHAIHGAQVMAVTDRDYYTKKAEAAASKAASGGGFGSGAVPEEIKEILIPAGTIVYAQMLTEANTDAPGPVLARISSGPLMGSRILGTFNDTDEYLRLEFNTVVVNGIGQPANAVALDPKTTLPAMATEIDRRYWKRVILPAAARFIEGMGDAVAQSEQTVTVNNGTTTSSQQDLNTRQELAAGLAEGTSELADALDEEGNRTKVMIKVHAGTPIGILFLEPVLKEEQ